MSVDFGKFGRLCQLEKSISAFFLIFFFSGCTHEVIQKDLSKVEIKPNWFKVDSKYTIVGDNEETLIHPYYDVEPNLKNKMINYILITPQNSPYQYNLDLVSGKLYKVRDLCPTEDIWNSYSSTIHLPNFDYGVIPQFTDELGNLQRIIIYKKDQSVGKFEYDIKHFNEARIVGSLLIDSCTSFPCTTKDKWKTSQILVGVHADDEDLKNVESLSDLKTKIDWPYTKAFLVNSFGSFQVGRKYFPAYRTTTDLNLEETIKNFNKRAVKINLKDLQDFRKSCFDLYDEIYNEVSKIRTLKNSQQDAFLKYFKNFYSKDSKQYLNCQKNIRSANINQDPDRNWFFAFLTAFVNLEQSGLYYSCYEKGWAYNPRVDDTKFFVDQVKEINKCRAADFEQAFDRAINGMSLLKNQLNKFFHYIEYDSEIGGSHQKIYSWILDDAKKISCETEKNSYDFFPRDVVWQSFMADEKETVH